MDFFSVSLLTELLYLLELLLAHAFYIPFMSHVRGKVLLHNFLVQFRSGDTLDLRHEFIVEALCNLISTVPPGSRVRTLEKPGLKPDVVTGRCILSGSGIL